MAQAAKKSAGSNGENKGIKNLVPFKPGQSGNPSGRPAGSIGLAAYIREQSMDGRALADFLMRVVSGAETKFIKGSDRIKACEILMDRAFGKVTGDTAAGTDPNLRPMIDLSKLNDKELEFLENVRQGLTAIKARIDGDEPKAT